MPNITDLALDLNHLSNLSEAVDNTLTDFGCEWILPIAPVDSNVGYWYVYSQDSLRRDNTTKGDFGDPLLHDLSLTSTAYGPLVQHQAAWRVPQRVLDLEKQPINFVADMTKFATLNLFRDKELALSSKLSDTAVLTQNTTLSGVNQWSDRTSSPFDKIAAGVSAIMKNSGKVANIMWMSQPVWEQLQNHPDLVDRVKYTMNGLRQNASMMSPAELGSLFGVSEVRVLPAMYNSAAEGQTAVRDFIWGKNFWIAYRETAPTRMSTTLGYTLTLNAPRQVDVWYEQRPQLNYVRVADYYEQKIVNANTAYLIKDAVA